MVWWYIYLWIWLADLVISFFFFFFRSEWTNVVILILGINISKSIGLYDWLCILLLNDRLSPVWILMVWNMLLLLLRYNILLCFRSLRCFTEWRRHSRSIDLASLEHNSFLFSSVFQEGSFSSLFLRWSYIVAMLFEYM